MRAGARARPSSIELRRGSLARRKMRQRPAFERMPWRGGIGCAGVPSALEYRLRLGGGLGERDDSPKIQFMTTHTLEYGIFMVHG